MARSSLRKLVDKHQGNLSAIAVALGISRQAVTRRLKAAKLLERAAAARLAAGVTGPRTSGQAVQAADDAERERMLRALAASDSDDEARARLGMARRSFYRKKSAFGLDAIAIDQARAARGDRRRAAS